MLPALVLVFAGIVQVNLVFVSSDNDAHVCPFTVIASGAACPTAPKFTPYTVNLGAAAPAAGPNTGEIDVMTGAS